VPVTRSSVDVLPDPVRCVSLGWKLPRRLDDFERIEQYDEPTITHGRSQDSDEAPLLRWPGSAYRQVNTHPVGALKSRKSFAKIKS
jgi:hypothetical protein